MKRITTMTMCTAFMLSGAAALAEGPYGARAAGELSPAGKKFAQKAIRGGMFEVKLGYHVESEAERDEVEELAERIADDHERANDKLREIAEDRGIELTDDLSEKHEKMFERFEALDDDVLGRRYVQKMIDVHEKDIRKFEEAREKVRDPELRSWIDETLPTLREHLEAAKRVQSETPGIAAERRRK